MSVSAGEYNCQVVRCSKFFEGCNKILEGNNDLVIIGDDNIDSYYDHNKYNNFRDHQLKDLRDNFIIQRNLTIHNDKPTFYRQGVKSCIDHITSNCPTKIKNVTTHQKNYFGP